MDAGEEDVPLAAPGGPGAAPRGARTSHRHAV